MRICQTRSAFGQMRRLTKCAFFFFFLMLMYKLQSTEDSSTWLVVRIHSAEDGHSTIQQSAGNQWCSQTTGADKNILKIMAPYTTGAQSTPVVFRR